MTTTLRSVLTQSKPEVLCKTKARGNTTGMWPHFKNDGIMLWEDFNLDVLTASYGNILDCEISTAELPTVPDAQTTLDGVEITRPNDVLRLIEWNDRLLRPTLAYAKKQANLHNGVGLHYHIATVDNHSLVHVSDLCRPVKVDHRIALDQFPMQTLVLGIGLPSSKFKARQVVAFPGAADKHALWPLRQLGNLCLRANTRYGYIATDQDLVVCCFHIPEGAAGRRAARLAARPARRPRRSAAMVLLEVSLMPIPWTLHGKGQLTTDLALWWLCMLAMSPLQRCAIVTRANEVGIVEWETLRDDDEISWVRRHRYSGFKVLTDEPPPAYETPSPGHMAAVDAAFSLHIDPFIEMYPAMDNDATMDMNPTTEMNPTIDMDLTIDPNGLNDIFEGVDFN